MSDVNQKYLRRQTKHHANSIEQFARDKLKPFSLMLSNSTYTIFDTWKRCHVQRFTIEGIDVTKAILGCDSFVSWLYQGGDSSFKGHDEKIDSLKAFEVMRVSADCGVGCIDLSPPLVEAFNMLQDETDGGIEPLGALQEWTCRNFIIDDLPLADYRKEIKVNLRSKLPKKYLQGLERSYATGSGFAKTFFEPKSSARPLTTSEIDKIRMNPSFFKERLELYRELNVRIVQFGGETADWLAALGRVDLLRDLSQLVRRNGFVPLLICHWTSLVLPLAERELDVGGYIVPLNKSWSLLTLSEASEAIKNVQKPVIAMKTLAQGALAHHLEDAFTYLVKKLKVAGLLVGVSSASEAKRTFSTLARILNSTSNRQGEDSPRNR